MAKALAERYRSIIPEEKERLEGLAKVDKERSVLYFLFQCHISIITVTNFIVIPLDDVRPART